MVTKNLLLELELATQCGSASEADSDRGVYSVTKSFQCVLRRHHKEALHGFILRDTIRKMELSYLATSRVEKKALKNRYFKGQSWKNVEEEVVQ